MQAGPSLGYPPSMSAAGATWLVALALLIGILYWWVSAIIRRLKKRHAADLVAQINALNELHATLKLSAPLPLMGAGSGRPDFLVALARHAPRGLVRRVAGMVGRRT